MLDISELAHRLRAKLAEEQRELTAHLVDGRAEDYANYCGRCQFLRALRHVEDLITELSREINDPKF